MGVEKECDIYPLTASKESKSGEIKIWNKWESNVQKHGAWGGEVGGAYAVVLASRAHRKKVGKVSQTPRQWAP